MSPDPRVGSRQKSFQHVACRGGVIVRLEPQLDHIGWHLSRERGAPPEKFIRGHHGILTGTGKDILHV